MEVSQINVFKHTLTNDVNARKAPTVDKSEWVFLKIPSFAIHCKVLAC